MNDNKSNSTKSNDNCSNRDPSEKLSLAIFSEDKLFIHLFEVIQVWSFFKLCSGRLPEFCSSNKTLEPFLSCADFWGFNV